SSAQQQAVGTLLGTAAAVRPDMSQEIASMANVLGGLAGQETAARQNIAGREISAITGTPVSFADVVKTAGGGEIEELYKQQVKAQQIGQVLGIGGTILGGMFGGPGGAAAGQQAGQAAAPTTIM
ncbi:MAG: hypothetical protein GY699_09575, partial [Desulfobacteraceae bacterium]|nr:hypothetical protein [Desulfobacteraceae bacterium]